MTGTAEAGLPADARILIVDDEPANVLLLTRLLERNGYERLATADNGHAALDQLAGEGADLVILDLHMPGMDGLEVLDRLEDRVGSDDFLPVLVVTADATTATRHRALSAGATDFLTKPIDAVEVRLRVANLLHARNLHSALRAHNRDLQRELRQGHRRRAAQKRLRQIRTARIRRRMLAGEPTLAYQPIVRLADGRLVGLEALSRFARPPHVGPDRWFEQAHAVGLGASLELTAARGALGDLDRIPSDCYVAVNLSPRVVGTDEFRDLVASTAIDQVVFELTEHHRVEDYGELLEWCCAIREAGGRIAVDDAGAGYASLQHILGLGPDIIKLDRSIILDIDRDPAREAMVIALVAFAADIGACLVAEGIESEEELRVLRDLGVANGQGFHIARPDTLDSLAGHGFRTASGGGIGTGR